MKKSLIKILLILPLLLHNPTAQAKVIINEVLPNPTGKDRGNEWVELYNNGNSNIDLNGWKLQKTKLTGIITSHEYKIINTTLRNTSNTVQLFNSTGLVDEIYYTEAPEGLSLTPEGNWLSPTPKAPNPAIQTLKISAPDLIKRLLQDPIPNTIYKVPSQIPPQQKHPIPLIPLITVASLLLAFHYRSSGLRRHL